MSVLGRPVLKREDLNLSVIADQRIGARWWQSLDGDVTRVPVDIAGFTGVAQLLSVDGRVWAEFPLDLATHPEDPYVELHTTPAEFADPVWAARTAGEYRFILTSPDGVTTVLAAGHLYLER